MNRAEILRKRAANITAAETLNSRVMTEQRAMTPDEQAEYDKLKAAIVEANAALARLDELAGFTEAAQASEEEARSNPIDGRRDVLPWRNPRHPFMLTRAIAALMDNRQLDGVEGETTQELAKRYNKPASGFYLPPTLAHVDQTRALDTTAGAGSITTVLRKDFIELLRARAKVQAAGASILSDMIGPFGIPRQTAGATASWVAEGNAPGSASSQTIGQVLYTPKTLTCYTDITRKFVKQTSIDAEAFVKRDLAAAMALGVDLGALNGGGTNAPTGLLQNANVPTVALGTDGTAPTWPKLVELETSVMDADADAGSMAYITNARVRGKLKTTVKDSNTAAVYLATGNEVNGYPVHVSNQVPKNLTKGSGTNLSAILFGAWEQLIIAMWGAVDVIVDPYTGGSAGTVRIVLLQEADVNPRDPKSFAKTLDVVTS